MTPKEKAEELITKYIILSPNTSLHFHRKCALIAVDEIIEALNEYDNRNGTDELQNMDRDFAYWEKVKEEIKKL